MAYKYNAAGDSHGHHADHLADWKARAKVHDVVCKETGKVTKVADRIHTACACKGRPLSITRGGPKEDVALSVVSCVGCGGRGSLVPPMAYHERAPSVERHYMALCEVCKGSGPCDACGGSGQRAVMESVPARDEQHPFHVLMVRVCPDTGDHLYTGFVDVPGHHAHSLRRMRQDLRLKDEPAHGHLTDPSKEDVL